MVGDGFLPADVWPLDHWAMETDGWVPAEELGGNLMCLRPSAATAAIALTRGLLLGRLCFIPGNYSWHTGTFPPMRVDATATL